MIQEISGRNKINLENIFIVWRKLHKLSEERDLFLTLPKYYYCLDMGRMCRSLTSTGYLVVAVALSLQFYKSSFSGRVFDDFRLLLKVQSTSAKLLDITAIEIVSILSIREEFF